MKFVLYKEHEIYKLLNSAQYTMLEIIIIVFIYLSWVAKSLLHIISGCMFEISRDSAIIIRSTDVSWERGQSVK